MMQPNNELIYDVFNMLACRSSLPEVFCNKKGVLKAKAFNFIKKETLAKMFSCEFCDIFKNTFFYRTLPVAASEQGTSKVVVTDMRYFGKRNFSWIWQISFQVRKCISSRKTGYVFWVWMNSSNNHERQSFSTTFCKQATTKLPLVYIFRKIFFIG